MDSAEDTQSLRAVASLRENLRSPSSGTWDVYQLISHLDTVEHELRALYRDREDKNKQLQERALDYARLSQAHQQLLSRARSFKTQLVELNNLNTELTRRIHRRSDRTPEPAQNPGSSAYADAARNAPSIKRSHTVSGPPINRDLLDHAWEANKMVGPRADLSLPDLEEGAKGDVSISNTGLSGAKPARGSPKRDSKRKRADSTEPLERGDSHQQPLSCLSAASINRRPSRIHQRPQAQDSGATVKREADKAAPKASTRRRAPVPETAADRAQDRRRLPSRYESRSQSNKDSERASPPSGSTRSSKTRRSVRSNHGGLAPGHLHALDFKIRPDDVSGAAFAFQETVRGKQQRKCLSGCQDPNCCGSTFEQIARIAGSNATERHELGAALRGDRAAESANDHLLRQYLGKAAGRLDYMCNAEKETLLQKATARDLANRHGKHRYAHARPPSPPGFWRADMPSTQEEERDLTEVAAREAKRAEQRYLEAMRPDGRFVLRK